MMSFEPSRNPRENKRRHPTFEGRKKRSVSFEGSSKLLVLHNRFTLTKEYPSIAFARLSPQQKHLVNKANTSD
jgi:hypothetical protein